MVLSKCLCLSWGIMRYHEFFSKNGEFGACPGFGRQTISWISGANLLMLPMCTMLPQEQLWQNTGLALTPHPYRDRCHGSWWMVGEEIDVGHFLEKKQYPILLEIKWLEGYLRLAINHSGGLERKFAMESALNVPSTNKQPILCSRSAISDWGFNPRDQTLYQGIKLDRGQRQRHR